jgi:hypothetical protein
MQYGYLEERTHGAQRKAVVCRPSANESLGSYAHSIFRRLLVHDQLPDTDITTVTDELLRTLALEDPAFMFGSTKEFIQFADRESFVGKWRKIRQDNLNGIRTEIKRRTIENPYHTNTPQNPEAWDDIPVPDRAYKNKPWQFDMLYRDVHFLAVKIKELAIEREAKFPADADLFRMKVNGLLAADKIVFALDAGENRGAFLEESENIIESKLSLDGLHLAGVFLDRSLESLQKLGMVSNGSDRPGALLEFGEGVREALHTRISSIERRLMLFMRLEKDHY